ncbi:unnamed protein product [Closterium sp. NIES-65]|nr:unnamed protein product [Closterium sp. NIES-65]
MYTVVVARYSSFAAAASSRLILPYLFPDPSSFATVEDLISHLRASDVRYRTALSAEFLAANPPPMYITIYFLVTRLPNSPRTVRDHFLALNPTALTVDDFKKHLLAAEKSIVAVGAARGTPRTPLFEGCPPSPHAPSYASAANVDLLGAKEVGAASAPSGRRRNGKGKGGRGESAALGTSESVLGAVETALSSNAPSEALHTFTLDSHASRCLFLDSTTLTPLAAPVAFSLADPSCGLVLAHSSTVVPCPAVPSSSLSGLHLPSFSTNLVSNAVLQDAWVNIFTPGG